MPLVATLLTQAMMLSRNFFSACVIHLWLAFLIGHSLVRIPRASNPNVSGHRTLSVALSRLNAIKLLYTREVGAIHYGIEKILIWT